MSKVADVISGYTADSDSAASVFGQQSPWLYRNNPRVPFEYYVNINLERNGVAQSYFTKYFVECDFPQIQPLIKSIEMPSMKIDTVSLNQYNRKRLLQNKISFEPIKMVFHDVVDGKTLLFWEMYYNYYFRDGLEPGDNSPKVNSEKLAPYGIEKFANGTVDQAIQNIAPLTSPNSNNGSKQDFVDVLADNLENHNFGYNFLDYSGSWVGKGAKPKYLIQSIEIFMVHAGRFNQVTLVNPRISAFSHDTLNYGVSDRTLELTFTIDYEYAFYNIENAALDEDQREVFAAEYMDVKPTFNVRNTPPNISTKNSIITSTPAKTGNNLQRALNSTFGKAVVNSLGFDHVSGNRITTSTSSLKGMLNIRPIPIKDLLHPAPYIKSFKNTSIDNLKTLGATTGKGILQSTVSKGQDFVIGSVLNGISPKKAYAPTDLASPIGATPGINSGR